MKNLKTYKMFFENMNGISYYLYRYKYNSISTHTDLLPKQYVKGEWTAKTFEDAKQMAMDFAESVS